MIRSNHTTHQTLIPAESIGQNHSLGRNNCKSLTDVTEGEKGQDGHGT